eukprot:TRINITY_DN2968_c0_g1_i1.p1 TRINITY_DN2968_c0_g1~~TRINITY_DN2968_c0_g1_i1.p1  ORF type:complete len:124 (-),score=11.08 TRINITY_DN2968_c0_g1_i1:45-416(-)
MEYLAWELFFVALLSFFGSFQAFLSTTILKDQQFSLKKDQVSPLARHLFGAWTLVASFVRLICSYHIHEKGIYLATIVTFVIALYIYSYQCFVARSIPIVKALPPFIVATGNLIWMISVHRLY